MKLYMKQKVFAWGEKFRICDEYENEKYYVEGEVFSFGKKLRLYDRSGKEVAYIHEKRPSFLHRYFISQSGTDVAEVVKEFTFFRPEYTVEGPGWTVSGDHWSHEYEITAAGRTVTTVSKHWFSWGDSYEIDIASGTDEVLALSVVLIIDAVLAQSD